MNCLPTTLFSPVLVLLLAVTMSLPSTAQVAPRPRTTYKPAVERLELRTYDDYVRAIESRDPDVREAVMIRMQLAHQILDDAMLERVLKAAEDPSTLPKGVAAAAATLCARGPAYFEKLTAQAVDTDPAAAAQARRILAFAAHAGWPVGFRPGNVSPNLPSDSEIVAEGEYLRQGLARGDEKVIDMYIRAYGGGSQPARRIGPVSFRAAKASANRNASVFRSNYQALEAAVQTPPNVNWSAPAPGRTSAVASDNSSLRLLLGVLTAAVLTIAMVVVLPYLIVRPASLPSA